jgi:hypothetical protein
MTAIGSYCQFFNTVPWGGYKLLVINPLASDGTHTCGSGDTIDLSAYFSTIDGAIGFKSGTAASCTWTTTSLVTGTASIDLIMVFGH